MRAWEVHKQTPKVPDDEDVLTYARRLVAERCLYGVDKNPFAVDLAKLSLWLATLAREHPFTFLDHALRHGDSLVGLSREQIACFNWDADKQLPLLRGLIDERVSEAQKLREQIQSMAASDDVPEKRRLLKEAEEALDDVRLIGDMAVSAFLEREKPKERQTLRVAYAGKLQEWLARSAASSTASVSTASVGYGLQAVPHAELAGIADALREDPHPISPFHWEIEFPEVFTRPNGGFDVFVGNPPFAGKNTLADSTRAQYPVWLQTLHPESHGNADLVAHFYRRAFDSLRRDGALGLIATNTIAQGDTRSTGLRWIRFHGGTIFAARKRIRWPGAAAVVVSVVHVCKGTVAAPYDLDGRATDRITAFLFHAGADDDPKPLVENASKAFIGSYVLGMGFTFDDTDKKGIASPIALMHDLIRKDPRNAERIFPYLGGEEVNDSPTPACHRYIINFEHMLEEEARRWPDLIKIVEAKVRGERGEHSTSAWWHFERLRADLYRAVRGLDRVLANCQVGPHVSFAFLPATWVYAHTLDIFAASNDAFFAVLQCRLHEAWARSFGSSMKDDLRYTPSDCFETFPFPSAWARNEILENVGRDYYEFAQP